MPCFPAVLSKGSKGTLPEDAYGHPVLLSAICWCWCRRWRWGLVLEFHRSLGSHWMLCWCPPYWLVNPRSRARQGRDRFRIGRWASFRIEVMHDRVPSAQEQTLMPNTRCVCGFSIRISITRPPTLFLTSHRSKPQFPPAPQHTDFGSNVATGHCNRVTAFRGNNPIESLTGLES